MHARSIYVFEPFLLFHVKSDLENFKTSARNKCDLKWFTTLSAWNIWNIFGYRALYVHVKSDLEMRYLKVRPMQL